MTKYIHAARINKNITVLSVRQENGYQTNRRGEEENSTDGKRCRERADGGKLLRELFGTGLGVLREERSVTPAITVREAECIQMH